MVQIQLVLAAYVRWEKTEKATFFLINKSYYNYNETGI